MTASPVRLNHAVFYVADLERSVGFYHAVFGMETVISEPRVGAAFLRLPGSNNHHDLGLFEVGSGRHTVPPLRRSGPGLYHLAWQVATVDDLVDVRRQLVAQNALVGESDHGATKSLYAVDPDGNEFEVMWMLPRDAWGDYENSATVEPLDLAAEVERWRGVPTAV